MLEKKKVNSLRKTLAISLQYCMKSPRDLETGNLPFPPHHLYLVIAAPSGRHSSLVCLGNTVTVLLLFTCTIYSPYINLLAMGKDSQ